MQCSALTVTLMLTQMQISSVNMPQSLLHTLHLRLRQTSRMGSKLTNDGVHNICIWWQRSKKNANADVKCEKGFICSLHCVRLCFAREAQFAKDSVFIVTDLVGMTDALMYIQHAYLQSRTFPEEVQKLLSPDTVTRNSIVQLKLNRQVTKHTRMHSSRMRNDRCSSRRRKSLSGREGLCPWETPTPLHEQKWLTRFWKHYLPLRSVTRCFKFCSH